MTKFAAARRIVLIVRRLQCGRCYCRDVQRKHFAQCANEFASASRPARCRRCHEGSLSPRASTVRCDANLRGHRPAPRNALSSTFRLSSAAERCRPTRGCNTCVRKHLVLESGPLDGPGGLRRHVPSLKFCALPGRGGAPVTEQQDPAPHAHGRDIHEISGQPLESTEGPHWKRPCFRDSLSTRSAARCGSSAVAALTCSAAESRVRVDAVETGRSPRSTAATVLTRPA